MADKVAITAGSGTDIATDDCGAAGHAQIFKLAVSADGSATPVLADSKGLKVQQATAADLNVTEASAAAIAAALGAASGAAVITDANGTIQQYLRGLVKLAITAGGFMVNCAQIAGTAISVNSGNKDAGTQRVILATDQPALSTPMPITGSGSAGSAAAGVQTIQGIASMTPVQVLFSKTPLAYCYNIPSQVHVASANAVHWDMFNADAALVVRIVSIRQIPNITTAVTGIVFDWLLERTTSVGTGGSAQTAWLADLNDAALDADITCRSKPSGAAAQSTDLFNYSLSSEETNAATIQAASMGGLELVPAHLLPTYGGKGIVLRQNQGVRCVQVTNSNAGNTGWLISFTVE